MRTYARNQVLAMLFCFSFLLQSSVYAAGNIFYKPENAWAADFIPFFAKGNFRLFYLHDWRDRERFGEGTPWYQIGTRDFLKFEEYGEMLPRGSKSEQDLYVFTGSVIEAEGMYHIFYTGHNPYFQEQGKPVQGVMHAVSADLVSWKKLPEETFYARTDLYEPDDWRDPFVFRNDETGEYWMLLAARLKNDLPSRRKGCVALCTSRDLKKWAIKEPFWAPGLYYTHECPDLFKIGDWWYLLYSTFTERFVTHYRMSKSLAGPWLVPKDDAFDGRAYYAAKTASDGQRRFLFGWNATKSGDKDGGAWNWGGNLVVHEIIQNPDGTLSTRIPDSIDGAVSRQIPFSYTPRQGDWKTTGNNASIDAPDSYASILANEMPRVSKIITTVTFGAASQACGIILRADDAMEHLYYVRLEPQRHRLVFDTWPREKNEVPHWVEIERPAELKPDTPHTLTVLIDDTVCEIYLDDRVAMSTRLYDFKSGHWGLFAMEGSARFTDSKIFQLSD